MTILLVDDEPRLRETIARSLRGRGYVVVEAGTHAAAIEAAVAGHVDLMVLDVNLPDGTGWDTLRDLDRLGVSVPTVVFSAVPPSAVRVREFRPLGVLHKPFPIDALLRFVREVERGRAGPAGPEREGEPLWPMS